MFLLWWEIIRINDIPYIIHTLTICFPFLFVINPVIERVAPESRLFFAILSCNCSKLLLFYAFGCCNCLAVIYGPLLQAGSAASTFPWRILLIMCCA